MCRIPLSLGRDGTGGRWPEEAPATPPASPLPTAGRSSHETEGAVGDEEQLLPVGHQAVQDSECLLPSQDILLCREMGPVRPALFLPREAAWGCCTPLPMSRSIHWYMRPFTCTSRMASWGQWRDSEDSGTQEGCPCGWTSPSPRPERQAPRLHRHILVEVRLVELQAVAQEVVYHTGEQCHLRQREDVHELLDGGTLRRQLTSSASMSAPNPSSENPGLQVWGHW